MFYRFQNGVQSVSTISPDPSCLTAAYLSIEELEQLAPLLGFAPSTVRQCREEVSHFRSSIEVYDEYSFGTIKRTGGGPEGIDCIAIYIRKNLFIVVDIRDSDGSTRAQFDRALRRFSPASLTAEKLIFAFLDAMIEGDSKVLEDMEFTFSRLEESAMHDAAEEDFTVHLLKHKKRLLLLHNYYEQMIDVGEALAENENDLFADEDLRYFRIFTDRADRLRRTVQTLREQLSQLRDAYQSTLELKLNRIMKTFTVLNAIFLPLSLIAGWYGMNLNMPEFGWQFGYPFVIGLSAAVVGFCVFIFKKYRWM